MKERWLTTKPDAGEKQEKWFTDWIAGEKHSFQNPEAKDAYQEKATMIRDAVQMKRLPKRIPVAPSIGYFPLEYAGVSHHQMMYDQEALIRAWQKFCDDFKPDIFRGPTGMPGRVFDLLDL